MAPPDDDATLARAQRGVQELRALGERVTRARRAVLEVLDRSEAADEHLTADDIAARVEASAPGVHRATVYRALTTLGELGLVAHTHIAGAATVYHLAVPEVAPAHVHGLHAHAQCSKCGLVIDVPSGALRSLALTLDEGLGFALEPEHAALLGTCRNCR